MDIDGDIGRPRFNKFNVESFEVILNGKVIYSKLEKRKIPTSEEVWFLNFR